jgi:hypothetical protein
MYGVEISALSSAIAKCWKFCWGWVPGSALFWPRSAIAYVAISQKP